MLHMEILRSPVAHARIRSIDASKAWDIPGVRLVLTGEMMATRNLAWMPTLSYDTQAVLATDKVRFQGQEVAGGHRRRPLHRQGRVRGDRRRLRAAAGDRQPDPVARGGRRRSSVTTRRTSTTTSSTTGRSATGRAPTGPSSRPTWSPRSSCTTRARTLRRWSAAAPIADFNRSTDKLTVYMTTQAPHIIRAAVALVAELPEHMIRIVSPDLGGGFGNKVPVYPGYVVVDPRLDPHRASRQVDRGPHRQPDLHRLRPRRLPQGRAGAAQGRQDPRRPHAHRRRPRRVLLRRPAQQVQDRPDALGVRLLRRARPRT